MSARNRTGCYGGTLAVVVWLWLSAWATTAEATRFHQYTKMYKNPPRPTRGVVLAGWLGSGGTEWLSGVDFLPDGTCVVAGSTLGPSMPTFAGIPVRVLGSDAAPPAAPVLDEVRRGRRKVRQLVDPWKRGQATGFVAALAPDLRSCRWAARLPWGSGSVTDMVADDTGIYVVGLAGPEAGRLREQASGEGAAFVARLAADGSRMFWLRNVDDSGYGVKVRRLAGGRILVTGARAHVFGSDGNRVRTMDIIAQGYPRKCRAVSPVDLGFARGWDSNTHTGREPWRQPHLVVATPGGTPGQVEKREYYAWDPKLVGSKQGHRLVSDSSIRHLYYDDAGMLYAAGWSDGGNTVFGRLPTDLHKRVPFKGLGFSLWGANVGSFAHVMKINPANGELLNYTVWASYLKGKERPNSIRITGLGTAPDGSLLMVGNAAHHLIQTGDAIHHDPMEVCGPYITILADDWSSIRFSTCLEGTAWTSIRHGEQWDMQARRVGNRQLAAFVGSATATVAQTDPPRPPPSRNPLQSAFGGGHCDGYLVVVDLGP